MVNEAISQDLAFLSGQTETFSLCLATMSDNPIRLSAIEPTVESTDRANQFNVHRSHSRNWSDKSHSRQLNKKSEKGANITLLSTHEFFCNV